MTSYSVDKVFVSGEKLKTDGFYYNYGVLKLAQVPGPKFRYLTVRSWDKPTSGVPVYFAGQYDKERQCYYILSTVILHSVMHTVSCDNDSIVYMDGLLHQ